MTTLDVTSLTRSQRRALNVITAFGEFPIVRLERLHEGRTSGDVFAVVGPLRQCWIVTPRGRKRVAS